MRPDGPTFLLLSQAVGWRTGHSAEAAVVAGDALRLGARAAGPLSLASTDESLGGLVLPRGVALDADRLPYLLLSRDAQIKRYDPTSKTFIRLPAVGDHGANARQLAAPTSIAIAGRDLYVADWGNRRIQVFALASLALRYVWGPWAAPGQWADGGDAVWEPIDVTAMHGVAYILDRRYGRVYRHVPGNDALRCVVDQPSASNRWWRVAVDRDGRIYLLVLQPGSAPLLEVFDASGQPSGEAAVSDPGQIRDRFDPPPLRLDHRQRFCVPASVSADCARDPAAPPPVDVPLAPCRPEGKGGLSFDRAGDVAHLETHEPAGPALYASRGTWVSAPLDSRQHRCQWHRVVLDLAALPTATRVSLWTRAADEEDALDESEWDGPFTMSGQLDAPPQRSADLATPSEFLIQSREGRYLSLKLELSGDGFASPAIRAVRIEYPRHGYLRFLPAIYSFDDESRRFLERLLAVFQTEWDAIQKTIDDSARFFDPDSVPSGPLLSYLASWLAQPLEQEWTWEQKRRLLTAIPKLVSRRGTVEGVRGYLRAYLYAITGISPQEQGEYPQIIEGFRERARFMVGVDGVSALGQGAPLWGDGAVGRLQVGVFSRTDEARLVSTGDPERDLFHEYAHRFRVFVPAAWIRTATAERMVRRALDAEKPAHTTYDLCLVAPHFRVGIQSTVGIDTIVGGYPTPMLGGVTDAGDASILPPPNQLGYDTVLASRPTRDAGLRLRPGVRVGIDTTLT